MYIYIYILYMFILYLHNILKHRDKKKKKFNDLWYFWTHLTLYIGTCCVMANPMTGSPSKISHVTTAALPSKVLMVTFSGADRLSEDKSHKSRDRKVLRESILLHFSTALTDNTQKNLKSKSWKYPRLFFVFFALLFLSSFLTPNRMMCTLQILETLHCSTWSKVRLNR